MQKLTRHSPTSRNTFSTFCEVLAETSINSSLFDFAYACACWKVQEVKNIVVVVASLVSVVKACKTPHLTFKYSTRRNVTWFKTSYITTKFISQFDSKPEEPIKEHFQRFESVQKYFNENPEK